MIDRDFEEEIKFDLATGYYTEDGVVYFQTQILHFVSEYCSENFCKVYFGTKPKHDFDSQIIKKFFL